MRKIISVSLVLILLFAFTVSARTEKAYEKVEMDGAKRISLTMELGAGEFQIETKNIDLAAEAIVEYDTRRIDYYVDHDVKRNICYIDMNSECKKSNSIDTEDNLWFITLSDKYPIEIDMSIGACDADFDLGGLPLTDLKMDIGAASGKIDFSKPNPERVTEINLEAGASSLNMSNIGNANFEEFIFSGGAGSFDFDFRGEYKDDAEINIEVGLGSMDLILPEDVAVRIETEDDNWLSSVDIHGRNVRETRDGIYESDDYDEADVRIILNIEVGLGSIDIYFK